MLNAFTDNKKTRALEAMAELGRPEEKRNYTSSDRGALLRFFCALGTPHKPVEIAYLQAAFHSLEHDDVSALCAMLLSMGGDINDASEIMNRWNEISADPIPKPMVIAQKDDTTDLANQIATLIRNHSAKPAELDESKVIDLIKKHSISSQVTIKTEKAEITIPTGLHHYILPDVLTALKSGLNVYLVGQAGSGKTTLAMQLAKALEVPFHFNGALDSEYKLTGFIDANGKYVRTAFRNAYEHGGLYLFDEIDASSAGALLSFNAALENGHSDFPDGCIKMHKDFYCIAAANTYGLGADRIYIGRNQLDGAFLDRFAFIEMGYDEKLERTLAGNDHWVNRVQAVRKAVKNLKIRHIVSPRASIKGATLLTNGMKQDRVEDVLLWKGLDADSVTKIKNAA